MKNSKTIYQGKLLTFLTRKERLPNRYLVDLEIVEHPGAVLVIPFLSRDKIVLLKQYRPVVKSYFYELPAGILEKGETLIACARREVKEETGYSVKKFTRLGVIYPAPGYTTEKIVIFKAEGLKKQKRIYQKDEIIQPLIVTKSKVKQLFRKGKITSGPIISALAFCGWL
ncbi:MAG TPA: ADP-ribose pyrophosphatase [Elusimicrobia bacterium]|jgi:ADP-ribose pyrophosphatase|nr:ADP-ribose pyrophosphatase [Elusimicrobiota bacterium]